MITCSRNVWLRSSLRAISASDTGPRPKWRANSTRRRTPYSLFCENFMAKTPTSPLGLQYTTASARMIDPFISWIGVDGLTSADIEPGQLIMQARAGDGYPD